MEESNFEEICRKMEGDVKGRWSSLFVMALVYVVGELSHFLLGIVTRPMAQEIHYGTMECLTNPDLHHENGSQIHCYSANSSDSCAALNVIPNSNDSACIWDYSGMGLQYQILAGPAFVAVFTVSGVVIGMIADRVSRHNVLCFSLLLLVSCTTLMGTARTFWHLVVLRMGIGAGESVFSPACSSMISDLFSPARRGLALGIFNWGIYFGYGISYAVGNFVTKANIMDMGWRWSYYISGIFGGVVFLLLIAIVKEPARKGSKSIVDDDEKVPKDYVIIKENQYYETSCAEEETNQYEMSQRKKYSGWRALFYGEAGLLKVLKVFTKPSVLLLTVGASVRHSAGFSWAYNTQPYYNTYFPEYNLGIWIAAISIAGGTMGVAVGGFVSDKLMKRIGLKARVLVLGFSQALATPFAIGVLYCRPPLSFYLLLGSYFFAEMWLGVLMAILLDLIPSGVQTTSFAIFLFIISNIGGNAPILVEPLRNRFSYRVALLIMFPGCYLLGSILFFCTVFLIPSQTNIRS